MAEHGQELVDMYLMTTAKELKRLRDALDQRALDKVVKLAHAAIGASGVMGFAEMAELLKALEQAAHQNLVPQAQKNLAEVESAFDALKMQRATFP
jgi:HPt (histidine-containing phosphotransfer) domain-containing protein